MDYIIQMVAEPDVVLHNVNFARYDQKRHLFVFIGDDETKTVTIEQERVIKIILKGGLI